MLRTLLFVSCAVIVQHLFAQQVLDVSSLNPGLERFPNLRIVAYADDSLYLAGDIAFVNGEAVNPIVKVSLTGELSPSFNFDHPYSNDFQNELVDVGLIWNEKLMMVVDGQLRMMNTDGSLDENFLPDVGSSLYDEVVIHQDSLLVIRNATSLNMYGEDGGFREIDTGIDPEAFWFLRVYHVDNDNFLFVTQDRADGTFLMNLFRNGAMVSSFETITLTQPGDIENVERFGEDEILIHGQNLVLAGDAGLNNGVYVLTETGTLSENSLHNTDLSFIGGRDNAIEYVTSDGNGQLFVIGRTNPDDYRDIALARMSTSGEQDESFELRTLTNELEINLPVIVPAGEGQYLLAYDQSTYDGEESNGVNLIDSDGAPVTSFDVEIGAYAIATNFYEIATDEYIIEGSFRSSAADEQPYLARWSVADGPMESDLGFELNDESVFAKTAVLENGDLIVGSYDPWRSLVKVYRDGFEVEMGVEIDWQTVDNSLRAIQQQDGSIFLGGSIRYVVNGQEYYGIIKLNEDYTVDESFQSSLASFSDVGNIFTMDDGSVVVSFYAINEGVSKLVKLNADGSLDDTFTNGVTSDGSFFPIFQLTDTSYFRYEVDFNEEQIIKLYDADFNVINDDWFRIDADRGITDFEWISDTTLLVSGSFRFINGTPRNGIAFLNVNGELYDDLDLNFTGSVFEIEKNGTTLYILSAGALNGVNSGGFSAIKLVPDAVDIATIENDESGQVTLTWQANPQIRSYEVRRTAGEEVTSFGLLESGTDSFVDATAELNVAYTYEIVSRNLFGLSTGNATNYEIVKPTAPGDLTAERQEEVVALTWTDNSDNETGFAVWRSADGGTLLELTQLDSDITTFTDETAVTSSAYTYVVIALSDNFQSDPSNEASVELILSIDEPTSTLFYPNPTNGLITIADREVVSLEVLDMSGRNLKTFVVSDNAMQLDLSDLREGIYFVRFYDLKGSNATRKLVLKR